MLTVTIALTHKRLCMDELREGATGKKMHWLAREARRMDKIIDAQEGPVKVGL